MYAVIYVFIKKGEKMKVTCSWTVSLLKFYYTEDIKDLKDIIVNGITLKPIINSEKVIESIIAEYEAELPQKHQIN